MAKTMKPYMIMTTFVLLVAIEVAFVLADNKGNGNGNSGSGNGTVSNGNSTGNGNNSTGYGSVSNGNSTGNSNNGNSTSNANDKDDDPTDYDEQEPLATGQEQAKCKGKKKCKDKILVCPAECPEKKPKKNKKKKGCFVDCSSKCEVTCKYRKPNCNGYGSLCYDPRFVGGDGVMFYFHGAKGSNFAIVSDENLHINAHFIGTRPQGRTRDYTWVQALAFIFDNHNLVIAAKRVSEWNDNVDALTIRYDNDEITIPTSGQAEWKAKTDERRVVIERTDETNSLKVVLSGLVEADIKVRPIGKEENKVHNYQLPDNDAFAHLETQFKFKSLSDGVEGVLGKTYRPDYVSPVKIGVPMPMMGGENKYRTPSLLSSSCKLCRFQRKSAGIASA